MKFHFHSPPDTTLMSQIPDPGKLQEMSRSKRQDKQKGKGRGDSGKLAFNNEMEAILTQRKTRTFNAFSLSELMEFQQAVEDVAAYQDPEEDEVTLSMVDAVRTVCRNAIRVHAGMRDSNTLGSSGENFKAYVHLNLQFLVMWREVYDNPSAELLFWSYATNTYAKKWRGCPGMAPKMVGVSDAGSSKQQQTHDICLYCGKQGHRSDSPIHAQEIAEGSVPTDGLQNALTEVAKNAKLSADRRKHWSARIRGYWAARCVESDASAS